MVDKKTKPKLKVEKRKFEGRKVKVLRREGILPANIYGKKIKSQMVQLDLKSFLPAYEEAGETSVVNLQLEGETKTRPVLIHNVQVDPVTDQPLHADFFQVSLKDKVTTEIPIELVGESLAVKDKLGILIQPLNEVEVEALPTDLPDKFELDIGSLKAVNDAVTVANLETPKGVKILAGEKEILAKIEPPTKEEEVVAPPTEEEVPEGEEPEGEVPAEGEGPRPEPVEGEKPEEKPGGKPAPEGKPQPGQKQPQEKPGGPRPARPEPSRGKPAGGGVEKPKKGR